MIHFFFLFLHPKTINIDCNCCKLDDYSKVIVFKQKSFIQMSNLFVEEHKISVWNIWILLFLKCQMTIKFNKIYSRSDV